jgi:hypothetical protein
MEDLVLIRTFNSSLDYEMVRSYLESCNIACIVRDETVNRAYIANVNGGVKLFVKSSQLEGAIQLLKTGGYLTDEDLQPSDEIKWIDNILNKFRKKE